MEAAVEEMLQSRSEHRSKQDPLVGAVLVKAKGKLLAATHRGDLRVGDHAEYTLIERYLSDKNLDGATLYVTLEPCTRRNPPKKPCAERVVGARIRQVFVGMTDPNPDICGRGVQYLMNHGVEVDFFDLDLVHEIRKLIRDLSIITRPRRKKRRVRANHSRGLRAKSWRLSNELRSTIFLAARCRAT